MIREERAEERTLELDETSHPGAWQSIPLLYSAEYWSEHECEEASKM